MSDNLQIQTSDFQFEEKRGRKPAENPFVDAVRQSWDDVEGTSSKIGTTMQVVLKNDTKTGTRGLPLNVVTATNQIRKAAAVQDLGVRIETKRANKKGLKITLLSEEFQNDPGVIASHTVIYFAAKPRMRKRSKEQ